jgi:DNA modification methylase
MKRPSDTSNLPDLTGSEPAPRRRKAPPGEKPTLSPQVVFNTKLGRIYCGDSVRLMHSTLRPASVDLIMTSPPFGLITKKHYGNEDAEAYLKWFEPFAEGFVRVLKETGSLVIDIGGSWHRGRPTRSLYHFELLIMLCRKYDFHLAQEFYWWNPAKLPTPAEWVTVRRVRVKDAVNTIWWLSRTPYPKASNRRILQRYSDRMLRLLRTGPEPGLRPSGHRVTDRFYQDNGGAIPPNLIALANTESNGAYQRYCRSLGLPEHPARFPSGIPAIFTAMLTDRSDLVLDPFAGSCVTGEVAESMGRRWICCERQFDYVAGAIGRFHYAPGTEPDDTRSSRRSTPYLIYPPNVAEPDGTLLDPDGGKGPRNMADRTGDGTCA